MEQIKKDIREIKESQIRMEADVRYHIKRTDHLEVQIVDQRKVMAPLYALDWLKNNYRFLTFLIALLAGIVYILNKQI